VFAFEMKDYATNKRVSGRLGGLFWLNRTDSGLVGLYGLNHSDSAAHATSCPKSIEKYLIVLFK